MPNLLKFTDYVASWSYMARDDVKTGEIWSGSWKDIHIFESEIGCFKTDYGLMGTTWYDSKNEAFMCTEKVKDKTIKNNFTTQLAKYMKHIGFERVYAGV